ncbi:hypothetical protein Y1Q_0023559 [Alligator mississippiensis]|uniref:Uncharacterized protein n=1 Tax=Alligator mississippiensis TaxID=8496 RepID=A0A151MMV5_ALLMI|nr:hypothetical protein Y1Q_0023559 [Alligator mississippiensis]
MQCPGLILKLLAQPKQKESPGQMHQLSSGEPSMCIGPDQWTEKKATASISPRSSLDWIRKSSVPLPSVWSVAFQSSSCLLIRDRLEPHGLSPGDATLELGGEPLPLPLAGPR